MINIGDSGMDWLELGPAPMDESRQRAELPNYNPLTARNDCLRFIELIRKLVGTEPEGAVLVVKPGEYKQKVTYTVVVRYDESVPEAVNYAISCEMKVPNRWE